MSCTGLTRLNSRCVGQVHAYGPVWPLPSNRSKESRTSLWSRSASAGTNVANGPCHGFKGDTDNLCSVQNSSHLLARTHMSVLNMAVAGYGNMGLATSAGNGNLLEQSLFTPGSSVSRQLNTGFSSALLPGRAMGCLTAV